MESSVIIGSLVFLVSGYILSSGIYQKNISVKSSINGKSYLVRSDVPDPEASADMLAKLHQRIMTLINFLDTHNTYHKRIIRKFNSVVLKENPVRAPSSSLTSYTINKGDEIVLCLRDPNTSQLHSLDKLTYVLIHEIAHIGCPEIGHTPLFKKIFSDLLKVAVFKARILEKTDYASAPDQYCGIVINESLL